MKETIMAIESETLSNENDKRFILVDLETGATLDDANGVGFRSADKAYASWEHKKHDRAKEKERAKKTEKILEWIQEHSSFCEGFGDDRATLTVKEMAQQMKAHQIKVDFTAKELCKVLQKGSL